MSEAAARPTSSDPSPSAPAVGGELAGFIVSSATWGTVREDLLDSPERVMARIASTRVSAVAFDVQGLTVPSVAESEAIARFVDELHVRGVSVVLHGATAGFLTAACLDGDAPRFATAVDLSAAVRVLREVDLRRRRCMSDRGRRINQLRMTARPLGIPTLCGFVRDRLERAGVGGELAVGLLRQVHAGLRDALGRLPVAEGDLSASATVHDGRVTITILDGGAAPEGDPPRPVPPVDRIHRFRILDRHNALVLEKDLKPGLGAA